MDNTNQYQYKLTKYRHLSKKNPNNPVYANKIQKYQTLLQVSQIQQGGDGLQNLLEGLDLGNLQEKFNNFYTELSKLFNPESVSKLFNTESFSKLFDPKALEQMLQQIIPNQK